MTGTEDPFARPLVAVTDVLGGYRGGATADADGGGEAYAVSLDDR